MIWATRSSSGKAKACDRRVLCRNHRPGHGESPVFAPGRSFAERRVISRTGTVSIEPDNFVVASLAEIHGLPVGGNGVVAVGEFADIAAAHQIGRASCRE